MEKVSTNGSQPQVSWLTVDESADGQRLDNFLMSRLKGLPRSHLYRILRKGEVRVNKGRVRPSRRLCVGDIVRVPPLRLSALSAPVSVGKGVREALVQSILYEDDKLLVLNKPAGLAVHGGSGVSVGVIEALRQIRPGDSLLELVHRIDKGTSGCLMIARSRSVLKAIQQSLRERVVQKTYTALVMGRWPAGLTEVNAPLQRYTLPSGERRVRVSEEGKPSRTFFSVLKRYKQASLIEARPVTGRTHQIRVHALAAGHPLCGDEKYCDQASLVWSSEQGINRFLLHASKLALPYGDTVLEIEAPQPPAWAEVLSKL